MTEDHWEEIYEVAGDFQAEIIRGFLEAQGIQVWLSQEGSGHSVYAVTVGKLGSVQILVPASQSQAARVILEDYRAGKYEGIQFTDETGKPISEEQDQSEEEEN